MSEPAPRCSHGRIHPMSGPPVRLEKCGYVWIIFGPSDINCWEGPGGAVLLGNRPLAVEVLKRLRYDVDDRGVVTPAVAA